MIRALVICVLTLLIGTAQASFAQEIQLFHTEPLEKDLPIPGHPLTLMVRTNRTQTFEWPLRALIVRDGRLMDILLKKGKLTSSEQPLFEIQVASPLRSLSYQFYMYSPEGKIVTSKQFQIKRSCTPSIQLAAPNQEDNLPDNPENLGILAESLERDVKWYRTVEDLVNKIHSALEGQ